MKIYKFLAIWLISILFVMTSCELDGEEEVDWRPGDSLIIQGSDEVEVGAVDVAYYVEGFTIKNNYSWTVNGNAAEGGREGEFAYVDFPAAGDYTIKVNNGDYEGTLVVTAAP
jgi:hypothetical protein